VSFEPLGPGSSPEALASRAGGKAARLAELERLGCDVPRWFCVPVEAFDAALAEGGGAASRPEAAADLGHSAPRTEGAAPGAVAPPEREAAHAEPALPVPGRVAASMLRALDEHGLAGEFVAVRSSGLAEDGAEHSFAGQFWSFLYVRGGEQVLEALGLCWGSAFSARSVAYRRAVGADDVAPRMGVIVQRMVDSESAGVAFSRTPLDPADRDTLVEESVWGQGEGLVAGDLEADRFLVDRATLEFEATVAPRTRAVVGDPERGGTRTVELDPDRARRPSLTPEQVREVAGLALRLPGPGDPTHAGTVRRAQGHHRHARP
jgi:pyruvate,water dikinase